MEIASITLCDPGPPISIDSIRDFEKEINGELASDYKTFLLRSNGGWAQPSLQFDWRGSSHRILDFRTLVPVPDRGIRLAFANLRKLGLDGFVPITSTTNDQDICLALRNDIGSVWICQNHFQNDVRVGVTVARVSDNFRSFCSLLTEVQESHCPIEELGRAGSCKDLEEYLSTGGDINAIGRFGFTILGESIKHDNTEVFEACLAHGAQLNNAVWVAVENDNIGFLKRLAEAGADVNEHNEFGDRPLQCVFGTSLPGDEGNRKREIYNLLVSLGAR